MSYTTDLLLKYYVQNKIPRLIPGYAVLFEADSWGETSYTNMGSLDVPFNAQSAGAVVDNAIVATSAKPVRVRSSNNVIGTGSFTIEAYLMPSSAILASMYGGWLMAQRSSSATAGYMQMYFSLSGYLGVAMWDGNNVNIFRDSENIPFIPNAKQYVCLAYDLVANTATKQLNDRQVTVAGSNYSYTNSSFAFLYGGWNASTAFIGDLFSFRIYNRALTSAEIANNRARDIAIFGA